MSPARQETPRTLEVLEDRLRRQGGKAVDEALRAVEKRRGTLVDIGCSALEGFLLAWSRGDSRAALDALEAAVTPGELTSAVRASEQALRAATTRRRRLRAELAALARDLGVVGVRLVLAALAA